MKTINMLILIIALLGFTSCMGNSCEPPHFNVFDWDTYNAAGMIYVNTELECSDAKVHEYNGKNIKIYGWLVKENGKVTITSDSLYNLGQKNDGRYFGILVNCTPEIQAAIDTCDLTKKCYLKGDVKIEKIMDGKGSFCCKVGMRSITLKSMDDIYFEEDLP